MVHCADDWTLQIYATVTATKTAIDSVWQQHHVRVEGTKAETNTETVSAAAKGAGWRVSAIY